VLCNLLENAGKYTPPGSHIHIDAVAQDKEILIRVADDGPGIPEGQDKIIFEKFVRGERESATPGAGLGLAVCQAIMQAHHGRIWVERGDPPHAGARFSIALPLGQAPSMAPEGTQEAAQEPAREAARESAQEPPREAALEPAQEPARKRGQEPARDDGRTAAPSRIGGARTPPLFSE
jgi:two-component system sensor histidine kinase KdpD